MESKTINEVRASEHELVKRDNGYTYVQPRCDIRESKNQYYLHLEMPGASKESLSVELKNGELLIEGKMKYEENGNLIHSEILKRNYRRVFTLGKTVDAQQIDAKWRDGILTLSLAKKEEAKPREIRINFN